MNSLSAVYVSFLILFTGCNSYTNIQINVVSPADDKYLFSLNHLKPAADLALEDIRRHNILPGYQLEFDYLNSNCDPNMIYAELWSVRQKNCRPIYNQTSMQQHSYDSSKGFSAFFGPVCSYVLSGLSRMNANVWKVPIVTLGGFAKPFRDRYMPNMLSEQYKFVTALGYNYLDPSELIMKTSVKYGWKHLVYMSLMEYNDYYYDFLHCTLLYIDIHAASGKLRNTDNEITVQKKHINITSFTESVTKAFTEEHRDSSIFLLCGDSDTVRKILLLAQKLKLDNGEYVFINVDLFNNPANLETPWKLKGDIDNKNDLTKQMFRHVFIVTWKPLNDAKYRNFSKKAKQIAKSRYNFTYDRDIVNNFVGAFYDSVILYAKTVQIVLNQGYQIDNASAITDAMKNVSFIGISGNVTIDDKGDRRSEYILLDMDPDSGKFRTVATYNGITDELKEESGIVIDWANKDNSAPPSTPKCAYDNHKCQRKSNQTYLVLFILMLLMIAGIITGIFIFRQAKFQAKLNAMNWLIPFDELETLENRYRRISKKEIMAGYIPFMKTTYKKRKPKVSRNGDSSREYLFENMKSCKLSLKSSPKKETPIHDLESYPSTLSLDSIAGIHFNNCQLYGHTAIYKGAIVTLKLIKGDKRIETNRELLLEVKKVKDLNYDHVCRFIGACLDYSEQYIVYEYCSKGSLKDILAQKQLDLDWMFKYSLIQDICRGMIYIHHNIGPHGNLKSSNCVVDSRFVLKITDFGIPTLRGREKSTLSQFMDEEYYTALLWTAPELLRMSEGYNSPTIKSDVYSFAIICQEVIYRKGPFYIEDEEEMTANEKILELKQIRPVAFRPSLFAMEGCTEECIKFVRAAWADDPSSRPDFTVIKAAMRKLNKSGDTGNILDNLLSRMEQYANNLEGLVAKKTEQYLEEKRRAENLLYSMLPRSVAEQLIHKQDVIAESYDSVTIYFSDIVGFTSLSAESTPMEVVLLLNKLYTTFDKVLESFDVYKVETIGDAYVVCSGLPNRNENLHAGEICRMAIAFLRKLFTFEIPHRPNRQLELRIGIHSGPVCAGVVGVKMPRYCLFGDTVNTSSRMESSGLPLKIHISESTKNILQPFNTFIITERGWVEMKGKGKQKTFWLHGENETIIDPLPTGAVNL